MHHYPNYGGHCDSGYYGGYGGCHDSYGGYGGCHDDYYC